MDKTNKIAELFAALPADNRLHLGNVYDTFERTYFAVGAVIGKYRIVEEADRGGMAVVYRAIQLDLDRVVALKVLPANITIRRNFVDRFLSEAHAVARLCHPNIVSIHEVAVDNGVYYLAMDFIPGKNLYYFLHQEKPKLVEVLEITALLCDALQYAHDQKILHRDLKLNNVIMRDNKMPVLIDFGLAKAIGGESDDLTKTGEIVGSPAYMAPERVLGGDVDERSDICSMGIMLYEMLTFKNPYLDPRSLIQTTRNVVEARPVPPGKFAAWLPPEIEAITLKAMAPDPDDRYNCMSEMADDIRRYQRGEQVLATAPTFFSRLLHYVKRHSARFVIGAMTFVFLAVIAVVLNQQNRLEKPHWQQIVTEDFTDHGRLADWRIYSPEAPGLESRLWAADQGRLVCKGQTESYIVFPRTFSRDTRYEFDIVSQGRVFNAGFFMAGEAPSAAYRFYVQKDGDGQNGICYPGSNFVISDYNRLTFEPAKIYHAVIEKDAGRISFWLNGILISQVIDRNIPPVGIDHQKAGFFSDGGGIAFDNLRIYRKAMPRLSRPTMIAERFFENGEYSTALSEYRELLLDYPSGRMAEAVSVRIANCLVRLARPTDAARLLNELEKNPDLRIEERSEIQYLQGLLENNGQRIPRLSKTQKKLLRTYPGTDAAGALLSDCLIAADSLERIGQLDSALKFLESLSGRFGAQEHLVGQLHLLALNGMANAGRIDEASAGAERMLELYRDEGTLQEARIIQARMAYVNGKRARALELLNLCVSVNTQRPSFWHAWMIIAQIDELERNYTDAMTIYRNIIRTCPGNIPEPWIARLRLALLQKLYMASTTGADSLLDEILAQDNGFALPAMLATYYRKGMSDKLFVNSWLRLSANDSSFYLYLATRSMLAGNRNAARQQLGAYEKAFPRPTWDHTVLQTFVEKVGR